MNDLNMNDISQNGTSNDSQSHSRTELKIHPGAAVKVRDAGDDGDDIVYPSSIAFVLVHLVCIAAIWTGITWQSVALCAALYWLRIFFTGPCYHPYFSHRAAS